MSDFIEEFLQNVGGDPSTTRSQELAKYMAGDNDTEIAVYAVRKGKPNADMSGVDIEKRWISLVVTREGQQPQTFNMSHRVSAAISSDLMRAARMLRDEEVAEKNSTTETKEQA